MKKVSLPSMTPMSTSKTTGTQDNGMNASTGTKRAPLPDAMHPAVVMPTDTTPSGPVSVSITKSAVGTAAPKAKGVAISAKTSKVATKAPMSAFKAISPKRK